MLLYKFTNKNVPGSLEEATSGHGEELLAINLLTTAYEAFARTPLLI